jgi:pyrroline-5-carboxylate reductase
MPIANRGPKVVFLGAGKLGSLLIQSWIKNKTFKASEIHIHVKSKKTFQKLKRLFPKATVTCAENKNPIPSALSYVIAVKPAQWSEIKNELKKQSAPKAFFISLMAGIKASQLEKDLQKPVVVAMTNTCIQVNTALTTLFESPSVSSTQLQRAKKLFNPFGTVYVLPEELFAKATALGGSHPAFIIWLIQKLSLIIADELKIKNSQGWVLQIFEGALTLLKKEKNSDFLLKQIATPGGCTEEGLKTLEELGTEALIRKVFEKCSNKADELGKN